MELLFDLVFYTFTLLSSLHVQPQYHSIQPFSGAHILNPNGMPHVDQTKTVSTASSHRIYKKYILKRRLCFVHEEPRTGRTKLQIPPCHQLQPTQITTFHEQLRAWLCREEISRFISLYVCVCFAVWLPEVMRGYVRGVIYTPSEISDL